MKRRARRAIPYLVAKFVAKGIRDSRRRWVQGLRGGEPWLTIPIAAITMYVLWHWAFAVGRYFAISFLIAATLSIVRGHIFTHRLRLVLVAVGVVIGTLVILPLGGDAWQAFRRGDTVAAIALAGVVVLAWLAKRQLETGRMKVTRIGVPRPRRRARRR